METVRAATGHLGTVHRSYQCPLYIFSGSGTKVGLQSWMKHVKAPMVLLMMASGVLNESCSSIATELQEVSPHSRQFLSWDRIPVTDQLPLHSPAPSGWGPDSLPSSCQLPPPQWLDLVPLHLGASIVLMSIRTDNLKLSLHNRDLALSAVTVAWSILHSH